MVVMSVAGELAAAFFAVSSTMSLPAVAVAMSAATEALFNCRGSPLAARRSLAMASAAKRGSVAPLRWQLPAGSVRLPG